MSGKNSRDSASDTEQNKVGIGCGFATTASLIDSPNTEPAHVPDVGGFFRFQRSPRPPALAAPGNPHPAGAAFFCAVPSRPAKEIADEVVRDDRHACFIAGA